VHVLSGVGLAYLRFAIPLMNISIINGPNLNLLGKRETDIYGNLSFDIYLEDLKKKFPEITFHYFQSNVEGELINELQRIGYTHDGIVLNPGGYTHTSVAIGDTIAAIKAPVVEVHISNVHAREEFRKLSHVSGKSAGSIFGLGLKGYELAVQFLISRK
jgi:3-dehydroquinate dehydratase II